VANALKCRDCNTSTYNMECINCMANWILRLDKPLRLRSIETQGRQDVAELKALIIKSGKGFDMKDAKATYKDLK
jgi:hypothetical protein